jgi:FAD/FMN-containing dehydrogenase
MHTHSLDRFVSFNRQSGVIVAESGITLDEVNKLVIPNGWFLPVSPGTKYATLGGAVANDVHGKNHHVRGTFGRHVKRFGLVRSDSLPIVCSPIENAILFAATIGGLGLTGVIDWIEFQLVPIDSSLMDVTTIRFNSLAQFFSLSKELDSQHEYSVAWVDCLATGASAGRGVFIVADHAKTGGVQQSVEKKLSVPVNLPFSAINPLTLRLLNFSYYHRHPSGRHQRIVSYDPFFYPLDRVLHWNRVYGRKGFQQYQCIIPDSNAEPAIRELLKTIAETKRGSFLAVMKKCGDLSSPGLLSFPMPGLSLALDFPQQASFNEELFPRLDALLREAGGRLYPAKDAHMSGEDFRAFYPNWEKVEALRDPVLTSRFWNRVTLP